MTALWQIEVAQSGFFFCKSRTSHSKYAYILKTERQEQEKGPVSAGKWLFGIYDSYFHYQNEVVVPVLSLFCEHVTHAFCCWTRHIRRTRAQDNIWMQEWLVIFAESENVSFTGAAQKKRVWCRHFSSVVNLDEMDFAFALDRRLSLHAKLYLRFVWIYDAIWPCHFLRLQQLLATSEYFWAIFLPLWWSCVSNPVAESHSASTFILILRPCTWVSD
jgi:hypothetical protein